MASSGSCTNGITSWIAAPCFQHPHGITLINQRVKKKTKNIKNVMVGDEIVRNGIVNQNHTLLIGRTVLTIIWFKTILACGLYYISDKIWVNKFIPKISSSTLKNVFTWNWHICDMELMGEEYPTWKLHWYCCIDIKMFRHCSSEPRSKFPIHLEELGVHLRLYAGNHQPDEINFQMNYLF